MERIVICKCPDEDITLYYIIDYETGEEKLQAEITNDYDPLTIIRKIVGILATDQYSIVAFRYDYNIEGWFANVVTSTAVYEITITKEDGKTIANIIIYWRMT